MSRVIALAAVIVLALPLAAAPVPKALKHKAPPVFDTAWHDATDPNGPVTFLFDAGGCLRYTTDGGKTFGHGTWTQDGDALTWETNGRYAEFDATFNAGKFGGKCKNRDGKTWAVELVKIDR